MLQYLVVILDNESISYCHYSNVDAEQRLIALDDLRQGVFFAMKENLMVQLVWPDYDLPQEYLQVIDSVEHHNIVPSVMYSKGMDADIVVWDDWRGLQKIKENDGVAHILHIAKEDLFENSSAMANCFDAISRLNIVITEVESFGDEDFKKYASVLAVFRQAIAKIYAEGGKMQLNLLTDRMLLEKMNNCNAGNENITLAPDGKLYVCPAFYYDEIKCNSNTNSITTIGDLTTGLNIKCPQLYKLSHSPICRICDAFQCRRCVWLNKKMTNEVNIPSHEQCMMAHLERNASGELLHQLRESGIIESTIEIEEKDYLDPFELIISNR